jgi:hypothetical protein
MRRPPPWIALVPLAAGAVVLGIGVGEGVRAARGPDRLGGRWGGGSADEVPLVEPAAVRLDGFPAWADPRWRLELEALLAGWPPFPANDRAALELLWADLESLSFLALADAPAVDRAGDLRLGFHLRRPVAAIAAGEGYLTVDAEGVVLSGRWPAPPRCEDLWLPVILPRLALPGGAHGDDLAAPGFDFDLAAPGDWLVEAAHLAALDTAASLARGLAPADRVRLGRIAIDGAGWDVRGPEDPGVLLGLEDGRWIAFGRPPSAGAPGELAPDRKWRAVGDAIERVRAGGSEAAWEIADVRWDVPELHFGAETRALVTAELERPGPEPEAGFPSAWRTGEGAGAEEARPPDRAPARSFPGSPRGSRSEADRAVDRPRVR